MSETFEPEDHAFAEAEVEADQAEIRGAEQADPGAVEQAEVDDVDMAYAADDVGGLTDQAEAEPQWVPTGDPRVDDAVARLADLPGLPVDEHVAVFDEVARRLHDALAGIAPES